MFGLREVDISQIPAHITKAVSRIIPDGPTEGGLNSEDWDAFSEDGVWIVQCSKDVKVSELLTGKKLKLNGTSTIPVDDEEDEVELTEYVPGGLRESNVKDRQYEAISVPNENCNEGVLLLLPDESRFKVVSAPVQGHIIVRESIEDLENPVIEAEKPRFSELPAGLKERHPVYGWDFTSILEKMEAAPIKSPKKKKKKSNDQERQLESHNGISSQNGVSMYESEQSDSGVKRKKGKQNKHDSSIEEEEDNFNDKTHLRSNGSVKKSFPLRVDFSTPYDDEKVLSSPKKKKSKKRKRDELDSSNDFERTDSYEEVNDFLEPPVKKKKKSKTRYFE